MQLLLTPKEVEQAIWNSLCNSGLTELGACGLELQFDDADYKAAKNTLKAAKPTESVCYEDVLLQMLKDGKNLTFKDLEGGEDDAILNIALATENFKKENAAKDLLISLDENDGGDAWTSINILQYAMLGDVIYG